VGRECGTHGRGMKTAQGFWFESPIEGDRSEDQSVDGRMGSECIFGRISEGGCIGFDSVRTRTGATCCECGDEPSGSCATDVVCS
jgi:hypothetical protein